jgi:hypothetical protein
MSSLKKEKEKSEFTSEFEEAFMNGSDNMFKTASEKETSGKFFTKGDDDDSESTV